MLWAVAFLGRMVSDAQLVFGFVLFIFGKSIRWRKKDAMSLSDVVNRHTRRTSTHS